MFFLYIAVLIGIFLFLDDNISYQVTYMEKVSNVSYKGIIIREEEVVKFKEDGIPIYNFSNGDMASVGDILYSMSSKKNVYYENSISIESIEEVLDDFYINYRDNNYSEIYNTKERLLGTFKNKGDIKNKDGVPSEKMGIISYEVDGYENINEENINEELLSLDYIEKKDLRNRENDKVTIGDEALRIVESNDWKIYIDNVDEEDFEDDEGAVYLTLPKGEKVTGLIEYKKNGGRKYAIISLSKYMINYLNDRIINFSLSTDDYKGLKILESCVVEKEYFTIPYGFVKNNDSNNTIILNIDGEEKEIKDYFKKNEIYYVRDNDISENVKILNEKEETYTISKKENISGVYNINKGYGVFKPIETLYKGNGYRIVEEGNYYGVKLYDNIAKKGNKVKESDVLY